MASPIFISNPPPGFSVIAILRGMQLALLGAYRSLQNPGLLQSVYYERVLGAIIISMIIQLSLWSPVICLRILTKIFSSFAYLKFLESWAVALKDFQFNVLNISAFVVSLSQYFSRDLDDLFLASLGFIDSVYVSKHPDNSSHQYHDNLVALTDIDLEQHSVQSFFDVVKSKYASSREFSLFLRKHLNNLISTIVLFVLIKIPFVGPVCLGLITFLSLNDKLGTVRSLTVFCLLISVPNQYSALFLNTYWGSRSMIRDLLLPYFSRVRFTKIEKEQWIKSREGLLFGFGCCFYLGIRQFPWIGLLIYGFAESAAAYLITKVSDPPPSQASQLIQWNPTQLVWNKAHEEKIIKGEFVNDEGFASIPCSFILEKSHKQ